MPSLAAALLAALLAAGRVTPCTIGDTLPGIEGIAGERINRLVITTRAPRSFGGPARVLDRLHVRSQSSRIARELLVAEGDTVDSLRVAESLRRVRALPFIESARVTSGRCREGGGVAVMVDAVDTWSLTPEGHYTTAEQTLGIHEVNLRGRGQALSAVMRWELDPDGVTYRVGGEVGFADPAATDAVGYAAGAANFADGRRLAGTLALRQRSLADEWIGSVALRTSTQQPARPDAQRYVRDRVELLAGRRLTSDEARPALYLQLGGIAERTRLHAAGDATVTGPRDVDRRFAGMEFGIARRATRYDTLTWILPHGGVVDAPRGVEADVVMSGGRDAAAGAMAGGADAWTGGVLQLGARTIASLDAWGSAYGARGAPSGTTSAIRGSVEVIRGGWRGIWRVRASAAVLVRPDPDIGSYAGFDAALPFLPALARRASRTTTVLAERTVAVRDVSRALELDAAVFTSWSMRRALPVGGVLTPEQPVADPFGLVLAGAGVRLVPARQGVVTVRLDLAFPVFRPAGVSASPQVIVTLLPSFAAGRRRTGPLGI